MFLRVNDSWPGPVLPVPFHRRLWSFFGSERIKIGSVPTFLFPTCKRSPSFWNRSASFFPEPVVLLRQPFTVNLMRFTPYIFSAIWRIKRRKLHHEKLQHMKAAEPWKDYEVEMMLNTFFQKHFPELSDTLLLRSKFVFSSFEETKIVRRIHLLSFEVRSQAHAD